MRSFRLSRRPVGSLVGAAGWGGLSAPLLLLRHWVAGYRFLDLLLCLFAFVVV